MERVTSTAKSPLREQIKFENFSFLIVMARDLDSLIGFFELFSDWMRYNPMANEFVRKVNVRVAIHQNVAECG